MDSKMSDATRWIVKDRRIEEFKQKNEEKSLDELISEAETLQLDINKTFSAFYDINKQVRTDIDDFCHIYENSLNCTTDKST